MVFALLKADSLLNGQTAAASAPGSPLAFLTQKRGCVVRFFVVCFFFLAGSEIGSQAPEVCSPDPLAARAHLQSTAQDSASARKFLWPNPASGFGSHCCFLRVTQKLPKVLYTSANTVLLQAREIYLSIHIYTHFWFFSYTPSAFSGRHNVHKRDRHFIAQALGQLRTLWL